jgi:spore coat protein U-like protein
MMRSTLFIAAALVLFPLMAIAGQATASFRISVTVVASCSVQTRPLILAPYATGGPATGTATPGFIDVSCTRGTPAAVYLDGDRVLAGPGGAAMAYTLQANGKPWLAGAPLDIKGQGREAVRLIISGSVDARQQVPLGDYADEKVVRVVY